MAFTDQILEKECASFDLGMNNREFFQLKSIKLNLMSQALFYLID